MLEITFEVKSWPNSLSSVVGSLSRNTDCTIAHISDEYGYRQEIWQIRVLRDWMTEGGCALFNAEEVTPGRYELSYADRDATMLLRAEAQWEAEQQARYLLGR